MVSASTSARDPKTYLLVTFLEHSSSILRKASRSEIREYRGICAANGWNPTKLWPPHRCQDSGRRKKRPIPTNRICIPKYGISGKEGGDGAVDVTEDAFHGEERGHQHEGHAAFISVAAF